MELTGVIWDVDGTLCDTLPLCIAAFRSVYARRLGRDYSDDEIVAGFGATEAGTLRAFLPDDWQAAEEEFTAEYLRLHDDLACVFPGVLETLGELRDRGVRQAVVTGKGPRTAAITLERLGLASYFDRVETGSPERPVKPEKIRVVLAAWNVPPGGVLYVGDTPYDARAAREAGVLAGRATWSATSGGMAAAGDEEALRGLPIFNRPKEVLAWATGTTRRT